MARVREAGMEDKILDSAFKVFGEQGFQVTTVKTIAEGAGISSGSIYTYFPDKEALFKAAVDRGWSSFIEKIREINRSRVLREERIALLLDWSFSTLGSVLPLIRGMFFEANKQNLIAPNVDRLCQAIVELIRPDEGDPILSTWEANSERRLRVNRIIVLGVLTSAAFFPTSSSTEAVENLKEALVTLTTSIVKGNAASLKAFNPDGVEQ
jgi:AcrR family transcriptional regulator